ncbi:hypothetical protein IT411_01940 [Candidatus Peregrinibacteria bacterium]|nr:hypothetical protein [Candidatus Peregrinibacteria bacterium]
MQKRGHRKNRDNRGMGGRGRDRRDGKPRVANSQAPDNTPVPSGLIFYCRTCEEILDGFAPATFNFQVPAEHREAALKKLQARKNEDGEERELRDCEIVYGTERSIKHFFKIKDDKFDALRREEEEKAVRADKL